MEHYNLVHYKEHAIRVSEGDTGENMLYSVVDVIRLMTHSTDARKYWNTQKRRLLNTDPELIAGCRQASLTATDGKRRKTDVAAAPVIIGLLKVVPGIDESEVVSFTRWLHRGGQMHDVALPLQTLPFCPGGVRAAIGTIHNDDLREIAEAEYAYHTGDAEKAAEIAGLYLDHGELCIRITAAYVYMFATMHLHRHHKAIAAFRLLENAQEEARDCHSPQIQRIAEMILFSARVLLHLPTDDMEHDIQQLVPELPEGLKVWACYIHCYDLYRKKKYEQILGVVETANAFIDQVYPIPLSYLNAFAAVALVNQKKISEAEPYLDRVMELCQPDGFYEVLGETQLILHGMVDVYIKPKFADDADRIDQITSEFFSGWLRLRKMLTEEAVMGSINKTEFIMAVLASRGWKNQEIAEYMGFSQNTIKKYLSNVFEKLNVKNRQALTDLLMK